MKISILTSKEQWFTPYANKIAEKINNCNIIFSDKDIASNMDICFILSYHNIIKPQYLKAKKNIIIHASDLPQKKGWSPMFWQILEGANKIVFSMFEADEKVDNGDIYLKQTLYLSGYELYDELREKQANFIENMCLFFVKNYKNYKIPMPQNPNIKESFCKKREKANHKLDINKTIKEQFNLLRISNNEEFPAFFEIDGKKYILKITKDVYDI